LNENLQLEEVLARVRPNVGARSRIEIPQRIATTTTYREMDIGFWQSMADVRNITWVVRSTMPNERSVGPRVCVPFLYLPHVLEHQAKRIPDAPAILAPGRAPLTYGRLSQHMDNVESTLRATGIGRRDRVAVVLPNGPEMAVAVLTVAASAVCAPMNPAYQAEELDRYFPDLRPRALIT